MDIIFTGALEDPRSQVEQQKDTRTEELFAMGTYEFKLKPEEDWNAYPIRNQNGSGMCGPFSLVKALGRNNEKETGEFVILNPVFIYNKRSNNSAGMWLQELLELGCKVGAPLDPTLSGDNIHDAQAAIMKFTKEQTEEALLYRGKNYAFNGKNFEQIAQLIDMGITPILLLRCAAHEWTEEPWVDPKVTPDQYNINHFVPGVDAFKYILNHKDYLLIDDSWGSSYGKNGRRRISREFFDKRIFGIGYVVDMKNEDIDKPKHTFTQNLTYGMMNSSDVAAMQKILQYEKFLVTHVNGKAIPLGNFLSMTARALKKWQIAHGIMDFAEENDVTKLRFGKKSITEANKIYQ